MAGADSSVPLQQYVASLDVRCLPKILQISSGVYFQGSIYELSGCDVCFSTGDLIKVVDVQLVAVRCEDVNTRRRSELPINFKGWFQVVPGKRRYRSVGEMLTFRHPGLDSGRPLVFTSHAEITIDDLTLAGDSEVKVLSKEQRLGGKSFVSCQVKQQHGAPAEVRIPLSTQGEFYECFSLAEIMSSPDLRGCRFHFIHSTMFGQVLALSPVYEVHALMQFRRNVVRFTSNIEMDVTDVTELHKDVDFVVPVSLAEVFSMPDESFPMTAEILEEPCKRSVLKSAWLPELRKYKQLIFHQRGVSRMTLASSLKCRKIKQFFLISQQYGGRFKRRPREFNSVFELHAASTKTPGIKVSVTRSCEEEEGQGLPALSVGEQLQVLRCGTLNLARDGQEQTVEALICQPLPEAEESDDEDEERREELALPLYMECPFVERITDTKKYNLRDLDKTFTLPLDVKVVSRDAEYERDPLVGLQSLRLEEVMDVPIIQASLAHSPDRCFEIPTQWVSIFVSFTQQHLPWPKHRPPKLHVDTVTEVTEELYFEFVKEHITAATPPPRPPKQSQPKSRSAKETSEKSSAKVMLFQDDDSYYSCFGPQQTLTVTKQLDCLALINKRRPPPPPSTSVLAKPPLPAKPHLRTDKMRTGADTSPTFARIKESKSKGKPQDILADEESECAYESVDEDWITMLKKAQENFMF